MARCVIKASPEVDLYLVWSSAVDHAVYVGTRAEVLDYLAGEGITDGEAMLARADEVGTSDQRFRTGAWDDPWIPVIPDGTDPAGWLRLPRANVLPYAQALAGGDEATALTYLTPGEATDD